VSSFAELLLTRSRLGEVLREEVSDPAAALRFLNPGRMVCVTAAPPDHHRQLPTLGQYQDPAAAAAAEEEEPATTTAAAAGSSVKHKKGKASSTEAAAAAAAGSEAGEAAGTSSSRGVQGAGPQVLAAVDAGNVWGVLVNFQKGGKSQRNGSASAAAGGDGSDDEHSSSRGGSSSSSTRFVIDVLINVDPATLPRGAAEGASGLSSSRGVLPRLLPPGAAGGVSVVLSLPLSHLVCLSAIRLKVMKDLRSAEARSTGLAMAAEVIKRHTAQGSGSSSSAGVQLPLLDPVQDMNVSD